MAWESFANCFDAAAWDAVNLLSTLTIAPEQIERRVRAHRLTQALLSFLRPANSMLVQRFRDQRRADTLLLKDSPRS